MLVRVADDHANTGQRSNFCRSPLGVAPRDEDFRQRVLALDAANGSAGILICGIGYRAGIQYDEIGVSGRAWRQSAGFELAFESGAVGLSGAASEVFDMVSGHGTIVAQSAACAQCPAGVRRLTSPRRSGSRCGSFLREAFAAEDRTTLRRAEGNRRLLAALRTGRASLYPGVMVPVARSGRGRENGHTFGLA